MTKEVKATAIEAAAAVEQLEKTVQAYREKSVHFFSTGENVLDGEIVCSLEGEYLYCISTFDMAPYRILDTRAECVVGTDGETVVEKSLSLGKDDSINTVVRACIHRGGKVVSNQDSTLCVRSANVPVRPGWGSAKGLPYPKNED